MSALSNAVAQNRMSTVVGYTLAASIVALLNGNLPQRIAILGEVNTANQASYPTTPTLITSANQAGTLYGFGSPIHMVCRILLPLQGGGTNAPVWVYPQAAASGSVARVQTITVTGPATAGGTHYVKVAGRNNIDGATYSVNVVSGDTATIVAGKIKDSINAVTASPVTATSSAGVVTVTAKWTGLSSESISLSIDTSLAANIGLSYVIAETVAGSGTPAVTTSLNLFGGIWNTIVINCYGTVSATLTELETFNGVPGLDTSTGRYVGTNFKPFIALTGSTADDPSSVTSGRNTQVTAAICPAPLSPGMQFEAAANMAVLFSNVCINDPSEDVMELTYPDMPMPAITAVPSMQDYNFRDTIVKLGCSTVAIENGVYTVKDFVTTFNDGTQAPPFQYCRNLDIDWNIEYGDRQIALENIIGYTICADNDVVSASKTVRPKQVKALYGEYFDELTDKGFIANPAFSKKNLQVGINQSNPGRIDKQYPYQRTSTARIASTTALSGFYYGN